MKGFKLHIILFSLFFTGSIKAQDFHLSMYDAGPLFLNPAMTGVVEANWRIHAQYRTQWRAVNFKPYQTSLLSFDMPKGKWGFGGQIANFRAGQGNYNVLQGLASVGYTLPIDKNQAHIVSFGLQGGLSQKSVEYQLLTFDNQYTTANGGSFDNGLPSGEIYNGQSFVLPDLNAGILYYYAKQQSRINPFIGGSVFNILEPTESWFGNDNKLPRRLYVHTGVRVNITETFFVIPKVLYMRQKSFSETTFAGDVGYFMKGNEFYLLGGIVYRNRDAVILSIGARKDRFIAKIAYDYNLSSLSPASTGRGGFELSFTYMHINDKTGKVKICPRL